jgi:NAD(P)H-hydrate epimerase
MPSLELMERAGAAVADVAGRMIGVGARILVLAGPGNNGGDGFVAARRLAEQGYSVRLALLGDRAALRGDAAQMAKRWHGACEPVTAAAIRDCDLIIDGLFGAGLSRAITGPAADTIAAVNASGIAVLAVDVPSGPLLRRSIWPPSRAPTWPPSASAASPVSSIPRSPACRRSSRRTRESIPG